MKSSAEGPGLDAVVQYLESVAKDHLERGCPDYPINDRALISAYVVNYELAGAGDPSRAKAGFGLKLIAFPQPNVRAYQWGWGVVCYTMFLDMEGAGFLKQMETLVGEAAYDMGKMSFRIARKREAKGLEPIPKVTRGGAYAPPPARPANHSSQD